MRYDNSLTSNVQDYIANALAKKVSTAQASMEISGIARDIRDYLCDQTTLNTPDFVIRRFIQTNKPKLLPQKIDLPDLKNGCNIPWPDEILDALAKNLFDHSKDCGTNISKKEWDRYLRGKGASKRDKVFQIAFTLDMDVESTIDLFLSFDMEAYSVRCPMDLICLFCQSTPGVYNWQDATAIFDEFTLLCNPQSASPSAPTEGMTRQITSDLKRILANNLSDSSNKATIIKYMLENAAEFVSFNSGGKRIFLPGYSLSRMERFMRLADYLAVLYPKYTIVDDIDPDRNEIKTMDRSKDGSPSLSFLARSMIYNSDWKYINWSNTDNDDAINAFEKLMRVLCQNYEQRMMKVERLRKGGNTVSFFERQDALLFVYFLINGYIKLGSDTSTEAQEAYARIDDMLYSGDDFDDAIAEALEKAEYVFEYSDDESFATERLKTLIECFDLILTQMDYMKLYLPARFDRFVVLSLLSATPDELTPLIMCQEELDYYESIN